MIVEIYGKQDCALCASAKRKVSHLLTKWGMADKVELVFHDMETEHGAAEGDFYDVFEIPSVLVKPKEDPDRVIGRWEGKAPPSGELRRLCA
ncbi:MAG: hypothetical protein R6V05_01010 [Candidatus Brocadiia bacterium]